MNEVHDGSLIGQNTSKWERVLFTILYGFFLYLALQLILLLAAVRLVLFLASWDSPNQLETAFGWLVDFFKDCVEYLSFCLLYTSPSPRDRQKSRMPSSA